jgi:hypothetical protein
MPRLGPNGVEKLRRAYSENKRSDLPKASSNSSNSSNTQQQLTQSQSSVLKETKITNHENLSHSITASEHALLIQFLVRQENNIMELDTYRAFAQSVRLFF